MNWLWWIFVFFMIGGFSWVADTGRSALRTRHERRVERIKLVEGRRLALAESARPPEPVCGCAHHLAKHDKQGKCHENVEVATAWDENRKPKRYKLARCNCQQYVGPQPLSQIYADDITDLDARIIDAQLEHARREAVRREEQDALERAEEPDELEGPERANEPEGPEELEGPEERAAREVPETPTRLTKRETPETPEAPEPPGAPDGTEPGTTKD